MKKQKNLKVSIIKGLERVPFGVFVLYILRILKLYFYYKPRFLINSLRANEADIFKVYWINPRSIKYCSSGKFNKRTDIGKAEGGD